MVNSDLQKIVIIKLGNQEFGIPTQHIIDVLLPQKIFPIPLSPKEIKGSINVRGKIVTDLDIKLLLGINNTSKNNNLERCIILDCIKDTFSFTVDEVKEVREFSTDSLVKTPDNLGELWKKISLGIHPSLDEDDLVVILDINKLIELVSKTESDSI